MITHTLSLRGLLAAVGLAISGSSVAACSTEGDPSELAGGRSTEREDLAEHNGADLPKEASSQGEGLTVTPPTKAEKRQRIQSTIDRLNTLETKLKVEQADVAANRVKKRKEQLLEEQNAIQ